jgi:hypothetical protein
MKKIGIRLSLMILSLIFQNTSLAAVPPSKGRIVIFADKKVGEFKTDKTLRDGTTENLENLKLVQTDQKNVHACFVGTSDAIKPILNTMIANSKSDLKLKTFATEGAQSSIHVQVISGEAKDSYLDLKIDPC